MHDNLRRTIVAATAALVLASGCALLTPAKPVEPPVVEVTSDCGKSCATLRALGCPEGTGSLAGESCIVICTRASQLRELPLACWATAMDVASARSCGSLRCIR